MAFTFPFPTEHALVQNPTGDLVRTDDGGELVLLPRLWDFVLDPVRSKDAQGGDVLTLRTATGMSARVVRHSDRLQVALLAVPAGPGR
jgi:hypothetical protein